MSTMDRYARETINSHPYPSTDPLQRLRHTVSVFADSDADDVAVMATSGVYPAEATLHRHENQTGLTHGDLRAILNLLGG